MQSPMRIFPWSGRSLWICDHCLRSSSTRSLGRWLGLGQRPRRLLSSTASRRTVRHVDRPANTNHIQHTSRLTRGGTPPSSLEAHRQEVEQVAASVKGFYDRNEKFRIYHGSTNSTRKSAMGRDPRTVVDTSRLRHVLKIDTANMTALVEPNVPMDRLVEETLKHGLVPPVVMEFPGITVGGGYSGTAGESSSFKHGFFDRTLNSVEMVLANGQTITASDTHNSDLFHGAAGAVGTLGVATMVELRLQRATKFVEATYHPVTSMQAAIDKLRDFTSRPDEFDYIDGVMYSPTSGAIVTGRMTDGHSSSAASSTIQRFSAPQDPWFYIHVRDRLARDHNTTTSDLIPLADYLFRYDRGGFWVGEAPFDYFHFPFNALTRRWLDDFLHTRMLYNALHASGRWEQMVIQDLALPYTTAADFVRKMDTLTSIWPLWLCPLKQSPGPTIHPHYYPANRPGTHTSKSDSPKQELEPMLNIGLWGRAPRGHEAFVTMNRQIESVLKQLGGMKCLYAQTYANRDAFWADFDKDWYDALRTKYHARSRIESDAPNTAATFVEHLPDVYDKVKVDVEAERRAQAGKSWVDRALDGWPWAGIRGLRGSIASKDYLMARDAAWKDWVPRN